MLVTLSDEPFTLSVEELEAEERFTRSLDDEGNFESLEATCPPFEEPVNPVPPRVREVLSSYRFELAATTSGAELYTCTHPQDPKRRYVITHKFSDGLLPARWSCSCPAFQRNQQSCKHCLALGSVDPDQIVGWNEYERKSA